MRLTETERREIREEARHDIWDAAERVLAAHLAARVASAAADREAVERVVERVRALAEEWRAEVTAPFGEAHMSYAFAAHTLRAALSVPTEAEGTS